jgi:hypothetical protein
MIHPDRVFALKELGTEDELVEAMINHTWPICYSFLFQKLLYLSDGESEDAPEYAVVTIDSRVGHHGIAGREVGRIKPRGSSSEQVHEFIQEMNAGHYAGEDPIQIQAEPKWHHSCRFCRLEEG